MRHRIIMMLAWASWIALAVSASGQTLPPEAGLPIIDWKDAADHVGKEVIVQGRIVSTRNNGRICFLNFDSARSFTAIVREASFRNFPRPPEQMYGGQLVRIRGFVSEYNGKPQIELTQPEQVRIVGAEATLPPPPPKPLRTFSGTLTLATYNVLNLFDEYDDPYTQDEGTPAKPRAELEKLAAVIRRVDADVLALQEVENRGILELFTRAMLGDMGYEQIVLVEGNDRRGIDGAILSRWPVGPVTSYRHLQFEDDTGARLSFQRDLLRAWIEPPGAPGFDVFVVHLKSKRGGNESTERTRKAEARALRRILDEVLSRDSAARFVLCGDFNDTIDSASLKIVRGEGAGRLVDFAGELPAGAVTYNREPLQSAIDFVFCSPAMAKCYVRGSYRVVAGDLSSSGSDHNPVVLQFKLPTRK